MVDLQLEKPTNFFHNYDDDDDRYRNNLHDWTERKQGWKDAKITMEALFLLNFR